MEVAALGWVGVVILGDIFKQPLLVFLELIGEVERRDRLQHLRLQARVEAHSTMLDAELVFAGGALAMPDEEEFEAQGRIHMATCVFSYNLFSYNLWTICQAYSENRRNARGAKEIRKKDPRTP